MLPQPYKIHHAVVSSTGPRYMEGPGLHRHCGRGKLWVRHNTQAGVPHWMFIHRMDRSARGRILPSIC